MPLFSSQSYSLEQLTCIRAVHNVAASNIVAAGNSSLLFICCSRAFKGGEAAVLLLTRSQLSKQSSAGRAFSAVTRLVRVKKETLSVPEAGALRTPVCWRTLGACKAA